MKKLLAILVALLISVNVFAYTFEGDIDPGSFFSFEIVDAVQLNQTIFMISLKTNTEPRFIICAVRMVGNISSVLAYAYLDKDNIFKHFIFSGGHYSETMPDNNDVEMLSKKLFRLNGISDS